MQKLKYFKHIMAPSQAPFRIPNSVLIYGLGRAGLSLAKFLVNKKTTVLAYDDDLKVRESQAVKELSNKQNFKSLPDITRIGPVDMVICSPGIPSSNPSIVNLMKRNIPIIDEIEFTSYFIDKPIIAVTGTNGKSTTTALIGAILTADSKKVFTGGNLAPGLPFSQALLDTTKDYYVVEISSFQLERCYNFAPKIALLLNISEDHLDRHQSLQEYINLKFRIFVNQNQDDYAIVNYEIPSIRTKLDQIKAITCYFSSERKVYGTYVHNGKIYYKDEEVCLTSIIKIPGKHNLNNVLAAIGATKIVGVKNSSIEQALRQFTGLPHRLELVRELYGVQYINNSMCTNPSAAVNSLQAITSPVILITGGKEKNLEIAEYIKAITRRAKFTILIGENRDRLKKELERLDYHQLMVADNLEQAVAEAQSQAVNGDTVLFSPGFASFDAFANFIERGEVFRNVVNQLT